MKINEYPELSEIQDNDLFIVETPEDGTKKIKAGNLEFGGGSSSISLDPAVSHRNTFRGKNLGDTFTEEQKEAIRTGTFDDLYIGDYWDNGTIWRIIDINYFSSFIITTDSLATVTSENHIIVMPDRSLINDKFNTTLDTTTGYINSNLKKNSLNKIANYIYDIFGSNNLIKNIGMYESSSYNASSKVLPCAFSLFDKGFEIPTLSMLSGEVFDYEGKTITEYAWNVLIPKFSLFEKFPKFVSSIDMYWIQNILTDQRAIKIMNTNVISSENVTSVMGIRPFIVVKG